MIVLTKCKGEFYDKNCYFNRFDWYYFSFS